MELIKLAGIMGASGASFASGSVLSDTGLNLFPGPVTHSSSSAPSGKQFKGFDLDCVRQDSLSPWRSVFNDLRYQHRQKLKEDITSGVTASSYTLTAPTNATGDVKACFRTTFKQTDADPNRIVGVTMELTMSKGEKHGIIFMNNISNIKDEGEKTSIFRAIFLERESASHWWEIKWGIQWSDEAFKQANKLTWEGFDKGTKEIDWGSAAAASTSLKDDPFSLSWNSDNTKGKKFYQHLTIKADPSTKPETKHAFWNGEEAQLATTPKPTAVFMDEVWITAPESANVEKAKDWFNLFKDEKGTWVV